MAKISASKIIVRTIMTMITRNSFFPSSHLKKRVKAPFVGKNSKKFPDGVEVVCHFIF